jgi:integrase
MSQTEQKKNSRARKRGRRVRTDGSPRLIAPGNPGNPYRHWAIAWTEKRGGKSRSRVATTHEAEESRAQDALVVFKAELLRPPPEQEITIRKICDAYIEARRDVKSFGSLQSALRPIRAGLGALAPSELHPAKITDYIKTRRDAKKRRGGAGGVVSEVEGAISDKTITNELLMLRAAFNWALDEGWAFDPPTLRMPKGARRTRKRTLSRKETGKLLLALADDATPTHLRTFVVVAMLTGQRSGAIRALRWEHIDFEEGMIWFTRTDPDAAENKRLQDHPIDAHLDAVLRDARVSAELARQALADRGERAPPLGYVIEYRFAPIASVKRSWAGLLRRAEVVDERGTWIHDLRRTAATYVRNAGRSNAEVALYLNDSEQTTLRSYAHAAPLLLRDMQRTLAAILVESAEEAAEEASDGR